MPDQGNSLKTVEMSFAVINAIRELDGARGTELADYLGKPQSTVHGHLATLRRNGYLTKDGDEYHIGLKFLEIGGYAQQRNPEYRLAKSTVEEVAEATGERAQFIVEEDGKGIYVHTETGNHAVQMDARIGKRTHLHASAAGKSVLAYLPEERVSRIIDEIGLPAITENTITDRNELFEELESIRQRGYSFNDQESELKLRAVGVPVMYPEGRVCGGLSISGPYNRLQGELFEEEIPTLLLGAANELELNISYA